MRDKVFNLVGETKVVAIIRGFSTDECLNIVRALYMGGIRVVEVTYDQQHPESFCNTANAISQIKKEMGDKMAVGAGTVITMEQLMIAKNAGAEFIVSPDTDEEIIRETVKLDMVSMPGAYTATEAKKAYNAGADFVKLFPCGENPSYLKAIKAPLSHIKFLAVGGVNSDNAAEFIKAGALGVGVGGSLTNKKWIAEGRFDLITAEAEKIIKSVLS